MWGWRPYVSVAERRAKAQRQLEKLRKKGKRIEPIAIEGREIAKQFWGRQWCQHLETFSDFDNRLPRGRTYVRNGSVCHLEIKEGRIEAIVSGSELYNVVVEIITCAKNKWQKIKEKCLGHIGSLLELLKGKLSDSVMKVVADHREGLFPTEKEIRFSCSCPDWADMCKHVAAVLYGVGSRLDRQPDLLFLLRGVNASELVETRLNTAPVTSEDLLAAEKLSELFDIELEGQVQAQKTQENNNQLLKISKKETVGKKSGQPRKQPAIDPKKITGLQLMKLRLQMQLSVKQFAEILKVTPASIYRWERTQGTLHLYTRSLQAIAALRP